MSQTTHRYYKFIIICGVCVTGVNDTVTVEMTSSPPAGATALEFYDAKRLHEQSRRVQNNALFEKKAGNVKSICSRGRGIFF